MSIKAEIRSQPGLWRRAARESRSWSRCLPEEGERVAVVGCGTSFHVATAYAAEREDRRLGETHAHTASEYVERDVDHLLLISRSGDTSEVVRVAQTARARRISVVTASADSALTEIVPRCAVLDYADEESVVQTRFATTCLALMLASLGVDLSKTAEDAERAMAVEIDDRFVTAQRFVFLGVRWTYGLAREAALKLAEMSLSWAEAHNPFEFRHGPIALTTPATALIPMADQGMEVLADPLASAGHAWRTPGLAPLARLVLAQRLGLEVALRKDLDPANPDGLTRAVILDDALLSRHAANEADVARRTNHHSPCIGGTRQEEK